MLARELPTPAEQAEFRQYADALAEQARAARELAILTLARPQMKRLDEYDLEALCALADDQEGLTLAEMVLNPALWVAGENGLTPAPAALSNSGSSAVEDGPTAD